MNALTIVHETIRKFVGAGDVVIDATAGRGYDTSFLCSLVGDSGKVISFDVQKDAVDSTEKPPEKPRTNGGRPP
ncbi:MAG: class I SAM-dependent methyltransferase [Clostridiales bacterium]|nr:MAG: class I SAM-dependent methyltransferase [Clostridiales bacterium]